MRSVGRLTDEEVDMLASLADEYFVEDDWTIEASLWDDGDVHAEAFSTVGNAHLDGYGDGVWNHRQVIRYERGRMLRYENRVEYECEEHKAAEIRVLNREELEF